MQNPTPHQTHQARLRQSAINEKVSAERGYYSVETAAELLALGFSKAQAATAPALMIPTYHPDGSPGPIQMRPDVPRLIDGRPAKYENVPESPGVIDVPHACRARLFDPQFRGPVYITEGIFKGDAAATAGLCVLTLLGVSNWDATDWSNVPHKKERTYVIAFDSDVMTKPSVARAVGDCAKRIAKQRGAVIRYLYLPEGPDGEKTGLDDYFARGGSVVGLEKYIEDEMRVIELPSTYGQGSPLSEGANAERYIEDYADDILYHPKAKTMLFFDGMIWAAREDIHFHEPIWQSVSTKLDAEANALRDAGDIKGAAAYRNYKSRANSAAALNGILTRVKGKIRKITHAELDTQHDYLVVQNGTIDLRTGQLGPHDRAHLATRCADVEYDPAADCPMWKTFIKEVSVGRRDLARTMREMAAYSLGGSTELRQFFVLFGKGGNGKSVFTEVLSTLLGSYAGTVSSQVFASRHSNERESSLALSSVDGMRLLSASETEDGEIFNTGTIKRLTGNDPLSVRGHYEGYRKIRLPAKYWIHTNAFPAIKDDTVAFFDRLVILPFDARYEGAARNLTLIDDLLTERSGILNWLIRAWQRVRKQKYVFQSREVSEIVREKQRDADNRGRFLLGNCILHPKAYVDRQVLFDRYVEWCNDTGAKGFGKIKFHEYVRDRLFSDGVRSIGNNTRGKGHTYRYTGIGLDSFTLPTGEQGTPVNTFEEHNAPPHDGFYYPDDDWDTDPGTPPPDSSPSGPPPAPQGTDMPTLLPTQMPLTGPVAFYTPDYRYFTAEADSRSAVFLLDQIIREAPCAPDGTVHVGFDIETTGLSPQRDRICTMQFSVDSLHDGRLNYVFDYKNSAADLDSILGNPTVTFVGQNLSFELAFLMTHNHTLPEKLFDVMLAETVLTQGDFVDRDLASIAYRYTHEHLDKAMQVSDWGGRLTPTQLSYAAADASIVLDIAPKQIERLYNDDPLGELWHVWEHIERRALPAITWMKTVGFAFDSEEWRTIANENRAKADALLAVLNAERSEWPAIDPKSHNKKKSEPQPMKWGGWQQVVKHVQERHGISLPNIQDSTLEEYSTRVPILSVLREWNAAMAMVERYGLSWLDHVYNGRIHPNYGQNFTDTGRLSCSDPNAQNIPRQTIDPRYRRCIIAPAGKVLVKADYNAAEMRVAAAIAPDETLLTAFSNGEDVHRITASVILQKTIEDVTADERQIAKAINFGLLFGAGVPTLQKYAQDNYNVTLDAADAANFRMRWLKLYSGIREWQRHQGPFDISDRYAPGKRNTYTLLGRRRCNTPTYTTRLNHPVQGTAADAIKLAMALLWESREQHPSARIVMCTHDEIVVECDECSAPAVGKWLQDAMNEGFNEAVLDRVTSVTEIEKPRRTWGK